MDTSTIQAVTPSDIFSLGGTRQSKRLGLEQKWFAVTGRVVVVRVEADGDLHIALSDASGHKQGTVVCEVPLKPRSFDRNHLSRGVCRGLLKSLKEKRSLLVT
jgi:hypothetical protein